MSDAKQSIAQPTDRHDPIYLRTHTELGRTLATRLAAESDERPLLAVLPDSRAVNDAQAALAFLGVAASVFPDWEVLPYDRFSPHQDLISDRLSRLWRLPRETSGLTLIAAPTLLQRLPPPAFVAGQGMVLEVGQRLDREAYRNQLEEAGYSRVSTVEQHGEYALRGGLIDVFPMGAEEPVRIDLFDDEIETLRHFDPESQRSTETVEAITLLPAREYPLTDKGIATFRQNWRNTFSGDPTSAPIYRQVSEGLVPAGIESYLPLFFDSTATLFDYLPETARLLLFDGVDESIERFVVETGERFAQRAGDIDHPILAPDALYQAPEEFTEQVKSLPRWQLVAGNDERFPQAADIGDRPLPELSKGSAAQAAVIERLAEFVRGFEGRTLLVAESSGRRQALIEQTTAAGLEPKSVAGWDEAGKASLGVAVADLEHGAILPAARQPVAVISETNLFAERVAQRRARSRRGRDADAIIQNLDDLAIGAPVVHEDHGVGRFQGLVTLEMNNQPQEYLLLTYADDDKLYVPVSSLERISRYTGGAEDTAPLHRLGSGQWEKAKKRAAKQVHDVAAELLDVHARRAARKGTSFQADETDYRQFAEEFAFEPTDDQRLAIEQVLTDMAANQPMDRVVCGDVGFGKTEVAMRAAFVAVENQTQVAVLVPTTLLAEQHLRNFRDRFANWPVTIESLSRLSGSKKTGELRERIKAGQVDIVIGTHKLLRDSPEFANLGLVIIDEEQRFGVRDKERLKALRAEVDMLTLTATPIPRTLNMALSGIRDLSIIATPPRERLAVKTVILRWDEVQIREAIQRELKRGGQVYFLHNEVKSIDRMARLVEEIVPEARIGVAHGQMGERGLEQVMSDFYHQRFNVLVSTTIIESGIDIPTANTILIHRADKFGLAQLHQLRGRVGRSHHRAYAYLITPEPGQLTPDAEKRLEAIAALEDLGVGFTLSTHDLEIRGAGELLGSGQSGQMHEVGYRYYMQLLDRAVAAIREGREPALEAPIDSRTTEVDLGEPALIPEDFVADVHTRLTLYKRLSTAENEEALDELKVELIDRFGLLPEPVIALVETHRLRIRARRLGITKIELTARGGRLIFGEDARIDPAKLVAAVQAAPETYRLSADTLRFYRDMPELDDRLATIRAILQDIALPESTEAST
ncbi:MULTISPECIES: transcription-repair coupling factor [unclassified Guyparkeria]|uniref:transcription-repair coupling factor n=1 Tax=unclassified Guyparkeria TaxID=2626246 RepID=UPI00073355D7|nr:MULTISPECIES: transcription-repair coupling factor [unclassified Guyparkeria]KTG17324.1 transcription-repair coupling factor [Guyparkeria sp. XI15]OAE87301.1 transcription-repair coupling factor [Guyparkeria sp. WRN-7]